MSNCNEFNPQAPKHNYLLDVRNLSCPLPFLKTKLKISELKYEQILKVIATDPSFDFDINEFANKLNYQIIYFEQINQELHYWLKVLTNDKTSFT